MSSTAGWLTVKEVATRARWSEATVQRWVRSGRLRGVKEPNPTNPSRRPRWLIDPASLPGNAPADSPPGKPSTDSLDPVSKAAVDAVPIDSAPAKPTLEPDPPVEPPADLAKPERPAGNAGGATWLVGLIGAAILVAVIVLSRPGRATTSERVGGEVPPEPVVVQGASPGVATGRGYYRDSVIPT